MLSYTVYSEAGGVGKSTLAANLAVAHRSRGNNVLLVDMDPQKAGVSYLLDAADDRNNADADTLALHLVGQGQGPFDDLIQEREGVDIIPSHSQLQQLPEWVFEGEQQDRIDNRYGLLHRTLADAGVGGDYDVLVIDPPAAEGLHVYNAIYATRNLVIPLELSGKGAQSIEGLTEMIDAFETTLDTKVAVPAIVPIGYDGRLSAHDRYHEEIEAGGFEVPVLIPTRESLFGGCWDEQCSAFQYIEEHRDYAPDYERETLETLLELAAFLEGDG